MAVYTSERFGVGRGGRVGRRQPPAKRLQGQKLCPGFESLPLRQTAPLAQVDRASDYESEGQRFESSRAHHYYKDLGDTPTSSTGPCAISCAICAAGSGRRSVLATSLRR